MTTEDYVSQDQQTETGLRLSRRHAIQGVAWSVPVITVATAAPAFAASGTAVITATWNTDSFRSNSGPNLAGGSPQRSSLAAVALSITVTGGSVSSLSVSLDANATGTVQLSNLPAARGTTTWPANNAALATSGFVASTPANTSVQVITFTRATALSGAVDLKFCMDAIANGDLPFAITVSSPDAASVVVTATDSTNTPFILGSP